MPRTPSDGPVRSKNGKDGFPKVRVFDESCGEIQNIPISSWNAFDKVDTGEGAERRSLAPSFVPNRVGVRRDSLSNDSENFRIDSKFSF